MDKFLTYLGGVLGGYALIETPVADTILSSLDPVLDLLGVLSMIVFSGAFVVHGVRTMWMKK